MIGLRLPSEPPVNAETENECRESRQLFAALQLLFAALQLLFAALQLLFAALQLLFVSLRLHARSSRWV